MSLHRIGAGDLRIAGGKAAGLGQLIRAGLPVPPGFCVTTAAYERFLASCGDMNIDIDAIYDSLERLDLQRTEEARAAGARVREHISALPVPPEVEKAVLSAWGAQGADRSYAVRSSATTEDLPGASFAGQHDTILDVRGRDSLLEGIRSAWISLFSDRAILYRARNGIEHRAAAMAVVVQEMVPADASGVIFTADPRTGSTERIIVEACRGTGETVVSGRVSPDRIVLDKKTLGVLEDQPGEARDATSREARDGTGKDRPVSGATVRLLGELARQAEDAFGVPLDIEWAARGGQVFLLQSRPITTLPQKTWEDRQVWTNANAGELLPDVVTPLTWALVSRFMQLLLDLARSRLGLDAGDHPVLGLIAGRVYFNLNTFTALIRGMPGFGRADVTETFGGAQGMPGAAEGIRIAEEDLPEIKVSRRKVFLGIPRFLLWLLTRATKRRRVRLVDGLRRSVEELERIDRHTLSDEALLDPIQSIEEGITDRLECLAIAGLGFTCFHRLRAACRAWLGDSDGAIANRLLAGAGDMDSAEAGLDLWRLAAAAHEAPEVRERLLSTEGDVPRESIAALAGGRAFLDRWDSFLKHHGHHARGELDPYIPRWSETPGYLLDLIRTYLRAAGRMDPVAAYRQRAAERENLTEACRRRLRNPFKRMVFNAVLGRAQEGLALRETLKSQFMRRLAQVRFALLDLGERLVHRAILENREDIFFLDFGEIETVVGREAPVDLAATIAARRAEHARNQAISPPPVVVGRYDPERVAPDIVGEGIEVMQGVCVSPGVVTGRARVIMRSDSREQVLPGEVLVAPFTDPGWTPYFLPASAIVMDMGGLLSHGSVVAREYGIPAVVNVGPATKIIKTGQTIRVDGYRGTVTIIPEDP